MAVLAGSPIMFGAAASAATVPAAISDVTVAEEGPTAATVSATISAGTRAQTVTVDYGTVSLDGSVPAGTVAAGSTKAVTADLTGLSPDTMYHYEVQAESSRGTEVATEEETFVTPIATIPGTTPDLVSAVAYLTSPTNLIDGDYYEPFGPGSPDVGLTVDGAFALAAAGTANSTLQNMVAYVGANGDSWTGIGTADQEDGAVSKEAVLAEAVGEDPRNFGGDDLIAALDATVCTAGEDSGCTPGTYENAGSTFDQAFGIVAQMRVGDGGGAAAPIAYLESQQEPNGAWPSLIPSTGDSDVDSTAMAIMALALVPGSTALTAVQNADAWLVTQQEVDGGFLGASGDNTSSTALAVMALQLAGSTYAPQSAAGLAFLAGQQNSDGGFSIADGDHGSDLMASTQALSGAVGTSFGTLLDPLAGTTTTTTTTTTTPPTTTTPTTSTTPTTTLTTPAATGTTATSTSTTSQPTTTPTLASTPQAPHGPKLARVSESHSRWREGRGLASLAGAPSLPVGTVFSFTLNEPATVTLAFTQTTGGRKVGDRCSSSTRRNDGRPRCARTIVVAKLSLHGREGTDRIRFDGRLDRSDSLSPGRYTAVITASADSRTSSRHALTFTIAARSRGTS